ncbi:PilT/PilU family type 4a pilus ATPase [Duodenibacillus massiliensis]|uniref:PilT/PilU family type 4a pilus ATPase n=1 Tax=Duodenibacillus massiliensis TaxID=1852381 RepID=UPI003AB4DB40
MKALHINLNTCLMRPLAAAFVAVLVLSGCATRDKDGIGKDDAFMQHWQNQSVDRQGFSPALEDLAPEPRVLMKQQSVNLHGTPRALPDQPITLKLQNAAVESVLRAMASAANVSLMMSSGVSDKISLNVKNARWSDVFQSILRSNGLDYRWQGKILQVMTAADKQKEVSLLTLNNQLSEQYQTAAAFREIPNTIPTLEELGLPNSLTELSMLNSGLVLLVGPTGSGKSTATAALVNYANEHRREHILTIEDPIEFRYESLGCMVSQREVGLHTTSFQAALRVALREDADIVVVGEMRDRETVRLALQAAETGHLVFATLHTRTAAQSVDRIISIFPEAEQAQMRMVLADTLKAVLSVSLMKRCDIKGRVQAMEIMLVNGAIRNLIREGKTPQINSVIQTSRGQGMCTMDDALKDLLDRGIISRETAAHYARDSDFLKDVRRI